MNWNDALKLIDPTEKPGNRYDSPVSEGDLGTFEELFGIYNYSYSSEFSSRMLKHWICSWVCTDTQVGLAIYCLDGIPVAVSAQPARKEDETIEFLSEDFAKTVRDCVLSYQDKPQFPLANLDEAIQVEWFGRAKRSDGFVIRVPEELL